MTASSLPDRQPGSAVRRGQRSHGCPAKGGPQSDAGSAEAYAMACPIRHDRELTESAGNRPPRLDDRQVVIG